MKRSWFSAISILVLPWLSYGQSSQHQMVAQAVVQHLQDASYANDLLQPQHNDRPFVGVIAAPIWRIEQENTTFSDRILAAQTVHHLRHQYKNAALLDVRHVIAEGLSVARTPQIIIYAQHLTEFLSHKPAPLIDHLMTYRQNGGKIIWIGNALPQPPLGDLPKSAIKSFHAAQHAWLLPSADTNAYATLALQAGAWTRRPLIDSAYFKSECQPPNSPTLFTTAATTWITPLVTLYDQERVCIVGAAWPKETPAVAYLPTYTVLPYLWTKEQPTLKPLELDLDSQGFEALDQAFAALHPPSLPPSAYTVPPEALSGATNYRSPLLFADNTPIGDANQWPRRRDEILNAWHSRMGIWPPLLTNQTLRVTESVECEGFVRHHVHFNWLPNEATDGYLLVPVGAGPRPAVITVFYDPEVAVGDSGNPYRDFAIQLTRRGFVTLSLGTRVASKRREYALYWPSLQDATVQPLSMLAYAAANAYQALSKETSVDPKRIGIVGHSFGGKWAMFASCLYEQFACGVWSDPGIVFGEDRPSINYWEPWYLGYHPKPWRKRGMITPDNPAPGLYLKLRKEGFDLTDLHALMAPRPFLVSGGAEDPPQRWQALYHAVQVNKLLGVTNRVALTNRQKHSPCAESNEQIYRFLEQTLTPHNTP